MTQDPLATLLEQAEAGRNQALAALNQTRMRCDAAREQALQLDTYRAEYEQRWSTRFASGAALEIVRCYQGFADRLEAAITQQAQAVAQAQSAQTQAGDLLSAHELRVASIRKLIERRAAAQRQAADRRDHLQADEASMRAAKGRADMSRAPRGVRQ